MDVHQIQQADGVGHGTAAEFVGGPQPAFVPSGQIAEERGGIVLMQPAQPIHVPPAQSVCCGDPAPQLPSWSSTARPSSRSRAVCTGSRLMPNFTMAKATSGWIPTTTVS